MDHNIKDKPKDAENGWGYYWLKKKHPYTWRFKYIIKWIKYYAKKYKKI